MVMVLSVATPITGLSLFEKLFPNVLAIAGRGRLNDDASASRRLIRASSRYFWYSGWRFRGEAFAFCGLMLERATRRTNLWRMLEVRPLRRSAIRRQRCTSSTTLVRRALAVSSSRRREIATSSSLPPRAKVWEIGW